VDLIAKIRSGEGISPMSINRLDLFLDYLNRQKFTPVVTFLLGGAVVGSMSNVYPFYVAACALLIAGLMAAWIYLPFDNPIRLASSVAWVLIMTLAWLQYFRPQAVSAEIAAAEIVVGSNSSQCSDFGRKRAMETLSRDGKDFSSIDLDCADLTHSVLTPGTKMHAASLTKVNAAEANFSGVDFTGSIMSASNFDSTNFSNANLGVSILGRHLLFEKTGAPRCYHGANVANAKFDNADLWASYLVGVHGLTCEQLRKAKNWDQSVRDPELACGPWSIPDFQQYDYIKSWPQKCQ